MKIAKIYLAETPGGAHKAYAVGYPDDYEDGDNKKPRIKSIPDQPLRGFDSEEEVIQFLGEKFTGGKLQFDSWAAGVKGSLLLKSIDNWKEIPLDGSSLSVTTKVKAKKRRKSKSDNEDDSDDNVTEQNIQSTNSMVAQQQIPITQPIQLQSQMQQPFVPKPMQIQPPEQVYTPQQFLEQNRNRQIAEGVVQVFESTLMAAAMYNVALNPTNLIYAYNAVKSANLFQWDVAIESAKTAAMYDQTWTRFRDAILQVTRFMTRG